mgnify:CR=1 FL=1
MNNKKETLVFSIICILGLLLVFSVYGDDLFPGSQNTGDIDPPQLTDLFPDRPNGPHQKFVSKESCLKCHGEGVEIPGMGTAPKIKHEVREDCTSCHKPKHS